MSKNKIKAQKKLVFSNKILKQEKNFIDVLSPYSQQHKSEQGGINDDEQRPTKLRKFLAFIQIKRKTDKNIFIKKKAMKLNQKEDIIFDELFIEEKKITKDDKPKKQVKQYRTVKRLNEKRKKEKVSPNKKTSQSIKQVQNENKELEKLTKNFQYKRKASFGIRKTKSNTVSKYSGLLEQKREIRIKHQPATLQQICIESILGFHRNRIKQGSEKSAKKIQNKTISTINF